MLSYRTISANKETVKKTWYVIDAEDQVLGRFASEVAKVLRGKNKADFTPHVDSGDNVIVINADKIKLTGNKWEDKEYVRYTGYHGGQRWTKAKDMLSNHPTRIIQKAVKGMLPKNRLADKVIANLHVYAGAEHPHSAQQPTELKF